MHKCNSCYQLWPAEVLKLVAWTVNGHAEAILLCPACQARYVGNNSNYTYLTIRPEVMSWLGREAIRQLVLHGSSLDTA